ncbi:uncharacterized protein I206_102616 [Kwoniella pini CBS 10737]|uniref:Transglutaminase-like domain-containing protein n=1 Tax=Kwoniella pini CBS 10737 TaxID=1296096 RepID=A0A1B9I5W5_9TREE|nr:uncharacterized protein I206_02970 [Kwoniella pini CBS 10737]OCF50908.1 hypothetical protein I206_02970 [Kwoniella pini CBS 10737]
MSFPLINPTYSIEYTFHQHLINYIATGLSTGKYYRIPSFYSPSKREIENLKSLWINLYSNFKIELINKFKIVVNRRLPNLELENIINNLKINSLNLKDDPNVNVHLYELRSLIPSNLLSSNSLKLLLPNSPQFLIKEKEIEIEKEKVDEQVLKLVKWFKNEYMKWVDPIKCSNCKFETLNIGLDQPNLKEKENGANKVELHKCKNKNCEKIKRFCRYTKIKSLINTREGRCGEWAQLFYVFLRIKGIESRYIWNSEDHVWCEYWSPTLKHWVHVDSCEAATNKPLLYARGWGKKQAFCLAFGAYGAEDVTRAYVDDWNECKQRRRAKGWKEMDLRRALYAHTVSIRLKLPLEERTRLEAMDNLQALWMADEEGQLAESERMDLGGRISGPENWRAMRDELGLGGKEVKIPKFTILDSLSVHHDKLLQYGNTRLTSKGILLTDGPSQTSSFFNPIPINQHKDIRCKFGFRLTSPQSGEADGIALIFSSQKGLGLGGYGLGYDGLGDSKDFAIEIDTYRTQDHADDPPTPHISLHSPLKAHHQYSLSCTKPGSIPFLSDGKAYNLEIFYQSLEAGGKERRVRGYLHTPDEDILEVLDVRLPERADPDGNAEWFVGISGSCGGLWQKQEILAFELDVVKFDNVSEESVHEQKRKEEVAEIEKDEM